MFDDLPIVRAYDTAQGAQRAVDALRRWGFEAERITCISGASTDPVVPVPASGPGHDQRLRSALRAASIPSSQWPACLSALRRGQVLLCVWAPFGTGGIAEDTLDEAGPVRQALEPPRRPLLLSHLAAPLSTLLGLPTVLRGRRFILGEPRVHDEAAPLSRAFRLPVLARHGRTLGEATGLPEIRPTPPDRSGGPRLFHSPAPFSAMLGLPVLLRRAADLR